MVRTYSVILGLGLAILWIAGLGSPNAAGWLTWLDGVAALCAFIIAGALNPTYISRTSRAAAPVLLSVGLFVLWIVGLTSQVVPWLAWWTFAFACAFLVLGLAAAAKPSAYSPSQTTTPTGTTNREDERFGRTG